MHTEGESDVVQFAHWFLREATACPHPPFADGVVRVGRFTGVVLFRQGPLQVQLWTCDPGSNIPEHSHPGVDVVQLYLWGEVFLTHNGRPAIDQALMVENEGVVAAYGSVIRILPGETHGARIGPKGGAFLTFQKWLNEKPRSVETAWEGDPLSDDHALTLKKLQPLP